MWTLSSDDFGTVQVFEKDLACLTKGQRLTDNVLDFIMTRLADHFDAAFYIPFFYGRLGLRPASLGEKNILLLNPEDDHWIIAIWEKTTATLYFLDSLRQPNLRQKYGDIIKRVFPTIRAWRIVRCGVQTRSRTLCGLFCFFNTWWFLAGRSDYDVLQDASLNHTREDVKAWIRTGRRQHLDGLGVELWG